MLLIRVISNAAFFAASEYKADTPFHSLILFILLNPSLQCVLWDNNLKSTKHMMKEMIMHYSNLEWAEGKGVNRSRTYEDLWYGLQSYKWTE